MHQRGAVDRDPADRSLGALDAHDYSGLRLAGAHAHGRGLVVAEKRRAVLVDEARLRLIEGALAELVGGQSEDPRRAAVKREDVPVAVPHRHTLVERLDDRLIALLAHPERLFGRALLAQIAVDPDASRDL